jgi:hypothetical protein
MTSKQLQHTCVAIVAAMVLGACGGGSVTKDQSTQISKGWELKDLQKALDKGAVTPQEYERIRQKILKRPN